MHSDLTNLYKKQISLTEWFEAIGHPDAHKLRLEDNEKRERLSVLNKIIGVPFDKPAQFSARDVAERSPTFTAYLAEHDTELCAVRIIPDNPALPKLRMRGYNVTDGTKWFDEQKIDIAHYRVDFVPHADTKWATIFVVNEHGVFGELTRGGHNELTQGFYAEHQPVTFRYDFKDYHVAPYEPGARRHIQDILAHLKVSSPEQQAEIKKEFGGGFAHDYLEGYFETTASDANGIWFIDYNRLLGDTYAETQASNTGGALVKGRCGSPGKTSGKVRIIQPDELEHVVINDDEILVCKMTTPDYLPLMQKAAGIVTELGGVLSHAAIVAREIKKPCMTGAKNATTILKNGQRVTLDADSGIITN